MTWHVEYTKAALKQLKKMVRFDAKLILGWIEKNLEGCENPRVHGKGLTANRSGEWRYRVGNYRILCLIKDNKLIVEVFSIGHRSEIYKGR
jgi:mRNA interferase RelE/StbE